MGLAACSIDAENMWQIGVDVLTNYRHQGIAASLSSHLTLKILEHGKGPFYGCAWSNVASLRTAAKIGFEPAWIEMCACPTNKEKHRV